MKLSDENVIELSGENGFIRKFYCCNFQTAWKNSCRMRNALVYLKCSYKIFIAVERRNEIQRKIKNSVS